MLEALQRQRLIPPSTAAAAIALGGGDAGAATAAASRGAASAASQLTGSPRRRIRTFMRCSDSKTSKGTPLRRAVVRAFADAPHADVQMIGRRFSYLSHGAAVAAFLATSARMLESDFCLIPLGITATSRRCCVVGTNGA